MEEGLAFDRNYTEETMAEAVKQVLDIELSLKEASDRLVTYS